MSYLDHFGQKANSKWEANPKANKNFLMIIIVSFLLFFSLVGAFIIYQYPKLEGENKKTRTSHIDGVVTNVVTSKGNLRIKVNEVEFVLGASTNYKYCPSSLSDFIQEGDYVSKPANSDSLKIMRNNNNYFYILEDHINKHLK